MKAVLAGVLLAALAPPAPSAREAVGVVTYLPASEVSAAFAQGRPMVETEAYKVHASRREAPGMVEVHVRDTDIIYVLEGSSVFVTGGAMREGKTIAPDEIRGSAIDGGATRTLSKGDVVIVPHGTPHWFREIRGPFLYYVVKVPAPAGRTT
jgi:mannose-6-phosphate isomerase-like protein (cupin superfamily)